MSQTNENTDPHKNIWLILIATCLFTFMSTLDASIVNIAMPTISKSLSINMSDAEWIVSVYMITICCLLIFWGKISDTIGKVKVFKIGTLIFVIGSLFCGISPSLEILLISRIVQALGASMTMATNYGIITENFPKEMRGKSLGILGSFVSLGSIAGPGIGGIIIQRLSWHYIFLINIPIGLFAIILGYFVFPKSKKKDIPLSLDFLGFILFDISIISLFMGIFIGQVTGFGVPLVIGLFILFVLTLIGFIFREKKAKDPLIDMTIFNSKSFSLGLLCALLIFSSNLFMNTLIPFYLQDTLKLSSLLSGFILMCVPIAMVFVAPISGTLSDKFGSEGLTFIGLLVVCISQLLFIFIGINTPIPYLVVLALLTGTGVALFQSPNNSIIMSSVAPNHLGIAGSINSLARNLGMVIGLSLSTTILYSSMSYKAGYKVTSYIQGRDDLFLYGLHVAFSVSFILCFIAFLITVYRLFKKKFIS
ncbi:MFS transporter [Terrisporobacter sp.]|uniref:MFS transporter n=1 Tax=Terrisporobacter sp. TaxID=1965305 RepID=UPI0026085845|nr:MFS transporter [Terrisporobacter sp.]